MKHMPFYKVLKRKSETTERIEMPKKEIISIIRKKLQIPANIRI